MNDTPGWASPGSSPSDGRQPDTSGAQTPEQPSDQSGTDQPQPSGKWSKAQPPPGQWTAPQPHGPGQAPPSPPPGPGWGTRPPTAPGGYAGPGDGWGAPQQGFGGNGSWGGAWGPPPAARPGVIPLRPLGVGEILDGAVSTMRTYWRTVLGISLTVAVVTETVVILLQGLVLNDTTDTNTLNDPSASMTEVSRALGDALLGSAVVMLLVLLGTIIATALLTAVTSRAVLGRPVTAAEAWRDARPQLARLGGLTILLPLMGMSIVAVGTLPGVLIVWSGSTAAGVSLAVLGGLGASVVALWILIRFSLASPALMLEKQSIRKAMSRSVKLVRGSWWRVFGIQLLAQLIAGIVASIVVIPFAFLAGVFSGDGLGSLMGGSTGSPGWAFLIVSGLGSVIGRMITFPITAGVTVLLYIDQRIRREALDLELARAAGLQDYGSGVPGTTAGS
ncbi:membrane protein [Streptomyces sp. Y2F8-2]|uniref:glycerophosphoryl diester phosphodiesterase membrane domain-containing protein n=1 Tax=Streptomyces sp. Y2F8-2 TaxID=2759675 RepID=UPI001907377E|nr:glycerophosphoryl diester phosphodiesterase membrane domain-containing protein [Streptomyces sp. Y2F8-2]GHJ99310.1 membrane protein [Streptomyces sp. Y2F8-2]